MKMARYLGVALALAALHSCNFMSSTMFGTFDNEHDPRGTTRWEYTSRSLAGLSASGGSFADEGVSATAAGLQWDGEGSTAYGPDGALYLADTTNNRIVKIASGTITTIAGTGVQDTSENGTTATAAALDRPQAIQVDSQGTIYFIDLNDGANIVRRIKSGKVETVLENRLSDGATTWGIGWNSLGLDASDTLYACGGNVVIKLVGSTPTILVGGLAWGTHVEPSEGLDALTKPLNIYGDLAIMPDGTVVLSDVDNNAGTSSIFKIAGGKFRKVVSSTDSRGYSALSSHADGSLTYTRYDSSDTKTWLYRASALTATPAKLRESDRGHRRGASAGQYLWVDTNRNLKVYDGSSDTLVANGWAPSASQLEGTLVLPVSVARGSDGTIYLAEPAFHWIRKLSGGTLTVIAGTGTSGTVSNGTGTAVTLSSPTNLVVTDQGNLRFQDNSYYCELNLTSGVLTAHTQPTLSGLTSWSNSGFTVDSSGNWYIWPMVYETGNRGTRIYKLPSDFSSAERVAGTGYAGDQALDQGNGGVAADAYIGDVSDVVISRSLKGLTDGTIVLASYGKSDTSSSTSYLYTLRAFTAGGNISLFAGGKVGGGGSTDNWATGKLATEYESTVAQHIAQDGAGNLYLAGWGSVARVDADGYLDILYVERNGKTFTIGTSFVADDLGNLYAAVGASVVKYELR